MQESRTFTTRSRRACLRGAGAIALGVGVAGCSSDGGGSPGTAGDADSDGSAGPDAADESASDGTSSRSETASSETPVRDASATDLSGTVSDESAEDLSFVEHSHYSMNGVQGVTGRIENVGDAPFEEVTLHVTVDPGDAGPFTAAMDAAEPLDPGDVRRFKFGFGDGAPDEVTGYTIWATGQEA